jgi:hypothetical protein
MSDNLNILDNQGRRSLALILNNVVVSKIDLDTMTALTILSGPTAVDITHINSEVEVGDLFDIKTASFTRVQQPQVNNNVI